MEPGRKRGEQGVKRMDQIKLNVACEFVDCRKSGEIWVVKVEGAGGKSEVMKNKYQLKGQRVYIENYASWEERRK